MLFPSLGKHLDPISKFCFGKKELEKDHAWQHVSPDFPLNGDEPPHSPIVSKLKQRMRMPRPSLESLKAWVGHQWSNKNFKVEQVQYLPNNYYMFLFEDPGSALQVVGHGQWLIKSIPLTVFTPYPGFNPRGPKPTRIPTWVDFPDLPIELYPWLKSIESWVGRVLGQRSIGGFIPKWDPQLLIEVDIRISPVPAFIALNKGGQLIKDCPDLKTIENPEAKTNEKGEGFQNVTRTNSSRSGKNPRQSPHWNKHNYNPLLENVFEPFSHLSEEFHEDLGPKEDGPAHHPEKVVPMPPAVNPRLSEQKRQFRDKGDMAPDSLVDKKRGNSSSDFEDETIQNTQKDKLEAFVNRSLKHLSPIVPELQKNWKIK
ncbi:hypothetical protein L7F22_063877 [Adiantum nelumboides]|nr:hypothetical protein [Adiantum nelumboides]